MSKRKKRQDGCNIYFEIKAYGASFTYECPSSGRCKQCREEDDEDTGTGEFENCSYMRGAQECYWYAARLSALKIALKKVQDEIDFYSPKKEDDE
jgi:hypothetical protein